MSADEIQLDESWVQDYNDAMQALNYNEGLIQQRREERKMPYEQRDNTYGLFTNRFKKDGSDEPDYRGDALIDGKEKKMSGWRKTDKNGNPFISGKFEDPQDSAKRFPSKKEVEKDPFLMD